MSLRRPQQFAISAILWAFLAAGSPSVRLVRAAAPPPSSHEAAVLDRIFANWKARHDRVHSLHFTWDWRTTERKGSLDYSSTSHPRAVLIKDRVYEQLGAELWMEGDDRMCLVGPLYWKSPRSGSVVERRVADRSVIVGQTTARYWDPTGLVGDGPPRIVRPFGSLFRTLTDRHFPIPISGFNPILLAFRPQDPSLSWLRKDSRLVNANALFDDVQHVELRRVAQPKHFVGYSETIWTSPARDDLVVRWKTEPEARRTCLGRINYQKDKTHGWIPVEWSFDYVGGELDEYKVTSYSINEKIDPGVFSLEFPPGTPVNDARINAAKDGRYYVVQNDGSKRTISVQEFGRLVGL